MVQTQSHRTHTQHGADFTNATTLDAANIRESIKTGASGRMEYAGLKGIASSYPIHHQDDRILALHAK